MSRVRTGHGPQDWSAPDDGRPAQTNGGFLSGSLVVGLPQFPHGRRTPRNRKPPVDMDDYAPGDRWAKRPRCPRLTRNGPCVRMLEHKDSCATEAAIARDRERRQRQKLAGVA